MKQENLNSILPLKALAIAILAIFIAMSCQVQSASAQNFSGAFDGMKDNKEPVQIESDSLEVQDEKGVAYFTGNVSVVQGSTILKTSKLTVYYARGGNGAGAAGNVKRIIATGKVAVRSEDQHATANKADVDMVKQMAVLSGSVTVSQGLNVVSGEKLVINMRTNAAKLTGGAKKRPSLIFNSKTK